MSSEIHDPSAFVIYIIDQLLSMDSDGRKLLVLDIVKRLRTTSELSNNSWKKNDHLIVVVIFNSFNRSLSHLITNPSSWSYPPIVFSIPR